MSLLFQMITFNVKIASRSPSELVTDEDNGYRKMGKCFH